jgi:hypothetical protein
LLLIHHKPSPAEARWGAEQLDRTSPAQVTKLKAERGIPRKSDGLLREGVDIWFGFIAKHRTIWPIK